MIIIKRSRRSAFLVNIIKSIKMTYILFICADAKRVTKAKSLLRVRVVLAMMMEQSKQIMYWVAATQFLVHREGVYNSKLETLSELERVRVLCKNATNIVQGKNNTFVAGRAILVVCCKSGAPLRLCFHSLVQELNMMKSKQIWFLELDLARYSQKAQLVLDSSWGILGVCLCSIFGSVFPPSLDSDWQVASRAIFDSPDVNQASEYVRWVMITQEPAVQQLEQLRCQTHFDVG